MPHYHNDKTGKDINIQDDLFGGSRKDVIDTNSGTKVTTWKTDAKAPEYPHYTQEADGKWHHSTDSGAKGVHTPVDSVNSAYEPDSQPFNLFDPSTW
jgi:hypothetical protein